ncbi:MAG: hypothetical protein J3Q66DRAFT_115786 [Benniella sp.]|nr:MAG: hypothetical protein J3Q66DRAFT_115786 [Benniella sp.]
MSQAPNDDESSMASQIRLSVPQNNPCSLPCPSSSTYPPPSPSDHTHTPTFQYVFLVARQPHLGLSREIRLHRLCPSPSIIHESQEHYHLTTKPGCLVKYPRDTLSRYRGTIKYITGALSYIVRGAGAAASTMANIPSHPANMAASALTSFPLTLDNKDRLNRAGIDYEDMASPQVISDICQKEVMEELFASTGPLEEQHDVVVNGRTISVCNHCYRLLQSGAPIDLRDHLTLSQYSALIKREPEVEVTLHNSMSVKVFTNNLKTLSGTHKIIIRIDPAYFEALPMGAPRKSIGDMFNKLARVLKSQRKLTHLEIHGDSTDDEMFAGLRTVLQSRSLETLHVYGIPRFLEDENIKVRGGRLGDLTVDGLVHTRQVSKSRQRRPTPT